MQTWATLAAKHATFTSGIGLGVIPAMGWNSLDGVAVGALLAGVGFAAMNSPRRAQSCQLPPIMFERAGQAQTSRPAGWRLARVRQRVDGLLTGMLSDDSGRMTPLPATWPGSAAARETPAEAARPDLAAEQRLPAPVAADTEPDLARAEFDIDDAGRAAAPEPAGHGRNASDSEELAPAPASASGERESDGGFWGPGEPGSTPPTSGYRSRHRLDAPARNATPQESRRTGPRHAAPPAGFGARISRGLTSPRLTSRSAAHAGG